MPTFSTQSLARLETCHPDLQLICHEVIKYFDFTVLEGHRGQEAQNKAFKEGRSKIKFPLGKHNKMPSLAVDIVPYPIDWEDENRFYYLAGLMMATAKKFDIPLRWGGCWKMDNNFAGNKFDDLPHFELS